MLKEELTGRKLKRDLGLKSASYRYHNKNNTGGNFGINLIASEEGDKDYELTGHYDTAGVIRSLKFGELYQMDAAIDVEIYEKLIDKIKYVRSQNFTCGYPIRACVPTGV